jgi:hypothetical protein
MNSQPILLQRLNKNDDKPRADYFQDKNADKLPSLQEPSDGILANFVRPRASLPRTTKNETAYCCTPIINGEKFFSRTLKCYLQRSWLPIWCRFLIYDQISHSCPSPGCVRCPTLPWQQSSFTLPLGQGIFRGLCDEQMPPLPLWSMICLGHQLLHNKVHPLVRRCKSRHPLLVDALDGMGRQHRPQEWPLHHGRGLLVLHWH